MTTDKTLRLKVTLLLLLLVILAVLFTMFLKGKPSKVKAANPENITYVSIVIEQNDTLWGIADRYYCSEFGSVKNYVAEIKRCNGLTSDAIYAGRHIIVPVHRQKASQVLPDKNTQVSKSAVN